MSFNSAIFPGSFDPFTKGHEDVVNKALQLFDKVIIAIGVNSTKNYLFALDKRIEHIRSIYPDSDRVQIIHYSMLTVHLCEQVGCKFIVRGLRDAKDLEYERSIAQMNKALSPVETVFFMTDPSLTPINASIVREIFKNGGKIESFVTNSNLLV